MATTALTEQLVDKLLGNLDRLSLEQLERLEMRIQVELLERTLSNEDIK